MKDNRLIRPAICLAATLAVCSMAACSTFTVGGFAEEVAKPNEFSFNQEARTDLSIKVVPLTENGTITAGEPLIAKIIYTNLSSKAIMVEDSDSKVLEVRDSLGKLLAATPPPNFEGDRLVGIMSLAPNESKTKFCLVSGIYLFTKPGSYIICIKQVTEKGVWAQNQEQVRVIAHNPKRLEERCQEIFPQIFWQPSTGEIPSSIQRNAIFCVRDDVALPYLDWMAREESDEHACLAMRKIGTPRSMKLVERLAKRDDKVGKAARLSKQLENEGRDSIWTVFE